MVHVAACGARGRCKSWKKTRNKAARSVHSLQLYLYPAPRRGFAISHGSMDGAGPSSALLGRARGTGEMGDY